MRGPVTNEVGGRLPFRRHIARAGVSPRCAAVVLPCFQLRGVPYHIVVARLTSYGMCHWSTRVRRASHMEMRFMRSRIRDGPAESVANVGHSLNSRQDVTRLLQRFRASCERPVAMSSVMSAWAARIRSFPGMFACTGGSEIRAPAVPSPAAALSLALWIARSIAKRSAKTILKKRLRVPRVKTDLSHA